MKRGNWLKILSAAASLFGLCCIVACFKTEPPPTLNYSPSEITFTATEGDTITPTQKLVFSDSRESNLEWSARTDAPWIILGQTKGTSTAKISEISVLANITGRSAGSENRSITISSQGAANQTITIPVILQVNKKLPPAPAAGWKKFDATKLEFSLPDSYVGGNLSDIDIVIEKLKAKGAEYLKIAEMIENGKPYLLFWAYDSNSMSSTALTNVNVVCEQTLSSLPLKTYAELAIKQFPSQLRFLDYSVLEFGTYEAGKITMESTVPGINAKLIQYQIKDKTNVFCITYTTTSSEFDQKLPIFDNSFRSIKIK